MLLHGQIRVLILFRKKLPVRQQLWIYTWISNTLKNRVLLVKPSSLLPITSHFDTDLYYMSTLVTLAIQMVKFIACDPKLK